MITEEIINFCGLDYVVKEEGDFIKLESTTKNKYGYIEVLTCPKNCGDKDSFQNKI